RFGELQRASGEAPHESGIVAINRDGSDSRLIAGLRARNTTGGIVEKGFERPWFVNVIRVIEGTNDVLVTARERSDHTLDVYRYDTVTGSKVLLSVDSPGNVQRWIVDFDNVPRAAVTASVDDDVSAWYVRKSANGGWTKVAEAKL